LLFYSSEIKGKIMSKQNTPLADFFIHMQDNEELDPNNNKPLTKIDCALFFIYEAVIEILNNKDCPEIIQEKSLDIWECAEDISKELERDA